MDDTWSVLSCSKKSCSTANMFAYGQVESPYGSGQFIKDLRNQLSSEEGLVLSEIHDRDGIMGSIKTSSAR